MKISSIRLGVLFVVLVALTGCSKPENTLVGKWVNEKTGSMMEFNSDKSGAILQRTNPNLPPNIPIKWALDGKQLKVEVTLPGAIAKPGMGKIVDKQTLVLEQDTFKKMK